MESEFPVLGTGNFGNNLLKSGLNLSPDTLKFRGFCLNSLYFPGYQGSGWQRQVRSCLHPPPVVCSGKGLYGEGGVDHESLALL